LHVAQMETFIRHGLWVFIQWLWNSLTIFWYRNNEWISKLFHPFVPRPLRLAIKARLREILVGLKRQ
jgi:hypothetical protein